jgi:hypothetical protein
MNAMTNFASEPLVDEREHLSEDQIDDHFVGDLSTSAAAHLAECDECSRRVARAAEPMASFRDVSMAWSERRSATMPLPRVAPQGLVWELRMGWAMASCALVLGFAVTGGGRSLRSASVSSTQATESSSTSAVAAPVVVAAKYEATPERVSADNRMLKAIDTELDAAVETPAALGLESSGNQQSSSQPSLED